MSCHTCHTCELSQLLQKCDNSSYSTGIEVSCHKKIELCDSVTTRNCDNSSYSHTHYTPCLGRTKSKFTGEIFKDLRAVGAV